jgi:hypothetical protein
LSEEDWIKVIDQYYWPLFKLADAGIPIGVEAPALTLEMVQDIDSEWINELSQYQCRQFISYS